MLFCCKKQGIFKIQINSENSLITKLSPKQVCLCLIPIVCHVLYYSKEFHRSQQQKEASLEKLFLLIMVVKE